MADRSSFRRLLTLGVGAAVLGAAGLGAAGAAQAQSTGTGSSTMSGYRTGYGMNSSEFSNPVNVATTDNSGNHIYVDGVSQNGASGSIFNRTSGGAGESYVGAGLIGSATAIGNNLQVSVVGSNNTVVVNSSQTNNAPVTATILNGKVLLDANGG